jgi:molybdate transport system substrate-binding protein
MIRRLLASLIITGVISLSSPAAEVHVAVAANFTKPMEQLKREFEKVSQHTVIVSFGSSGQLYSQIKNGAPYEVLLSADRERPERLVAEGEAVSDSLFTYAVGKLVLWSKQAHLVDKEGKVLSSGQFQHLAMANPQTAPYGAAAKQVMEKLGVWEALKNKIVQGENITQTYQFVATSSAELGFIALSQYQGDGSSWFVPQEQYSPIEQGAVLLKKGKNHQAAQEFIAFLQTPAAHAVIKKFGYVIPEK